MACLQLYTLPLRRRDWKVVLEFHNEVAFVYDCLHEWSSTCANGSAHDATDTDRSFFCLLDSVANTVNAFYLTAWCSVSNRCICSYIGETFFFFSSTHLCLFCEEQLDIVRSAVMKNLHSAINMFTHFLAGTILLRGLKRCKPISCPHL